MTAANKISCLLLKGEKIIFHYRGNGNYSRLIIDEINGEKFFDTTEGQHNARVLIDLLFGK